MSENSGRSAGFTLVELLVAITLLALVSAALFGGLRFGARAWESAADRIERDGEIEAVQELLRRTLSEASDLAEAEADSMVGTADGLSFFAPLPRHAGAGGIGRYRLELDKGGRLLIAWEPRRPGAAVAAPPAGEPTIILADVERISIGYFGAAANANEAPEWRDRWSGPLLPRLLRIDLQFKQDDPRRWPELVIAPRLARPAEG
jgi:general secretion pathway protein J